jgi:hypothetical protein
MASQRRRTSISGWSTVLWVGEIRRRDEEDDRLWKGAEKAGVAARSSRAAQLGKAQAEGKEAAGPIPSCSQFEPRMRPEEPAADASRLGPCKRKACPAAGCWVLRRRNRWTCARCGSDNHSPLGPAQAQGEQRPDKPMPRRMGETPNVARSCSPGDPRSTNGVR